MSRSRDYVDGVPVEMAGRIRKARKRRRDRIPRKFGERLIDISEEDAGKKEGYTPERALGISGFWVKSGLIQNGDF